MIPREPKKGSGREPVFIRDIRSWGSDVVKSLRTMQPALGHSTRVDWDHRPSFSARFQHQNEFSSSQKLEVDAGSVIRDESASTISVAAAEITLPASGPMYVYVGIALGAGTGSIVSYPTRPSYRPDADTVNAVLGMLTEESTGLWSWTPHHIGDITIDSFVDTGENNLSYPFQGSIVGNTIKVGADRAAASYYFTDHIMCGNDKLAKTAAETTSTISATSYVYYACAKSGATITATLSHKTVASGWPTDSDGTENYVLGVAVYSGSITSWAPAHISGQIRIGSARFS